MTKTIALLLIVAVVSSGCEAQCIEAQADLVRAETEQAEIDSLQDAQNTLAELLSLSMAQTDAARSEAAREQARAIRDQQEIIRELLAIERSRERQQTAAIVVVSLVMLLGSLSAGVFLLMRRQQEEQRRLQLMMVRLLALQQGASIQISKRTEVGEWIEMQKQYPAI